MTFDSVRTVPLGAILSHMVGATGVVDVLALGDAQASEPGVAGAKAAALARAKAAGLPVLDGFVVIHLHGAELSPPIPDAVRVAWESLSAGGTRPLVVRSSSAIEDTSTSSMAGQFTTVVGVRDWSSFTDALDTVARAGARVHAVEGDDAPFAILVQPMVRPRVGGVVFGVDPVTGRTDHRVIAAVAGLPEDLVGGKVSGSRFVVDERGTLVERGAPAGDVRLGRRDRRRIVELEARCAQVFGAPQDVEWGIDDAGRLWLFQSRPITTARVGVPHGPVLGPGPIAETFPDPLTRLEQDLWAEPLRRALGSVFTLLGVASPKALEESPLLVTVDGRVAVDLDLLETSLRVPWYAPVRQWRSIRAAWRIGRLRAALVQLGENAVAACDEALLDMPAMHDVTDRQLVAALERLRDALHALHSHEMLAGLLLAPDGARLTASSIALRVLTQERADGVSDDEIPVRQPIVLVLSPPRVGPAATMPREVAVPEWTPETEDAASVIREALRIRVRWVQEAGARYAWELGCRLAASGDIEHPEHVRDFDLDTLEMTVRGLAVAVPERRVDRAPARPLPARFRLSDTGLPIPVLDRHPHQGTGAGGGRGEGPVHLLDGQDLDLDLDHVPDGVVLVVSTLDPRLAPVLARCRGLVAETGSVLAHLSILAREAGVPTVVGLEDATTRFVEGQLVCVDGVTGAVAPVVVAPVVVATVGHDAGRAAT